VSSPLVDPQVAQVLAVFVGQPRTIGEVRGRPVRSGIAKQRVMAGLVVLSATNLAGDRQADLTVHGGPDKAVYAYPSEHYPAWQADGFALDVGGVGENLALAGVSEHDVRLGDVWRWGGALVQVSQPRAPCYKLALHTGRKHVGPRMIAARRTGWYLRVLETGEVPTSGTLTLVERTGDAPTIAETFGVLFDDPGDRRDGEVLDRVLASPALAAGWREPLVARRAGVRS
jgi:MOSC domain-containing protein YiiM